MRVPVFVVTALIGCGRIDFEPAGCWAAWHDGSVTLGASRALTELLGGDVGDPDLTDQGRRIHFWAIPTGGGSGVTTNFDVFTATRDRTGEPWRDVAPVTELDSPSIEFRFTTSDDGLVGVFNSDRDGSLELWHTRRAGRDARWETPSRALTLALESEGQEYDPELRADGLVLHFARERSGIRRIMRSERPTRTAAFGAPVELFELPGSTHDPSLSPDGRVIVITAAGSSRSVMFATRPDTRATFGPLQAIPNLRDNSYDPEVSPDGCELYYRSSGATSERLYVAPVE